ncbi:MAG: hypothetical protein A2497_02550 [Candidatus Firestonebacteria bacterium RifOxyC12_full_39_7]|nr:MAG: hypothetical protein A2536_10705 [Candidatus Firestonebacteria bacterium RIFOXYD2_FULL_39_29]OGF53034.1 MAG: hypothetical protein A2497_02550 [Candidatus Firestonebacteria bacterium RifOxyC12_full_39_7]
MKKIVYLITIFAMAAGSSNAAFEDRPAARPSGLGDAFTAMSGDVSTMLYNPANLSDLKNMEISLTYSREFLGIDYDGLNNGLLCFSSPITRFVTAGISFLYFSSDLYKESTLSLAAACKFNLFGCPVSIGATGELLGLYYTANAYTAFDNLFLKKGMEKTLSNFAAGITLKPVNGLTLGCLVDNILRPDISLSGDGSAIMPREIRGGISYKSGNFTPTADVIYTSGKFDLCGGVEYWSDSKIFGLRCGANSGEITFGASYVVGEIEIDYAFIYPVNSITGTFGSHLISLDWKFIEKEKKEEKSVEKKKEKK